MPADGDDAQAAPAPASAPVKIPDEPILDHRSTAGRAALARRHPRWGAATMLLMVVGVVVGFVSLYALGDTISGCGAADDRLICAPRAQGIVVALPVASMVLGLMISLFVGRRLGRLGRSPVIAAGVGWAVFLVAVAVTYAVAGGVV